MNSSPSNAVDLEEIFAVSESIEELAETNPKLYEEIKSHFSAPEEAPKEQTRSSRAAYGRRFSLDALPPNVAEILNLFDYNGTGKVTLDDVRRGAQELRKAKKKNKVAMWAMIVQFSVYAALTAAACGLLYHFLNLMHDTTVDTSTGNMMVKDGSSSGVEVSIRSHGMTFSYDGTVVDSATGLKKGCVSTNHAVQMFEHVLEGVTLMFVKKDENTGDICVVPLGHNNPSVWTDSVIELGGLVLTPDVDCSNALLEAGEISTANNNEANRMLSIGDIYQNHLSLRDQFWDAKFNCQADGRHLSVLEDLSAKQTSLVPMGYSIETSLICASS